MLELQLVYTGDGRFHTASKLDLKLVSDKFGAGEVIVASIGKRRSFKQHRWIFAMIEAAHDSQTAGPLFDTPERLRKWLLIKSGHCDVHRFAVDAISPDVAKMMRAAYDDIDFTTDGSWVYVKRARSIAWTACNHDTITAIADRIIDIIVDEIVPGSTRADWEPFKPTTDTTRGEP